MRVIRSSVFPADADVIWEKLKEIDSLKYVAAPMATFSAVGHSGALVWEKGCEYDFVFKLFGFIPFGTHHISIRKFDSAEHIIVSYEHNENVRKWNHRITLKTVGRSHTLYTDIVDIDAGIKTLPIYIWANIFYAHRQRRWIRLLRNA